MSCKICGGDTYAGQRICSKCLLDWSAMRKQIWDYHEKIYGKLSNDNLKIRQKDTKRLEKIWRKDKDKFQKLLKGGEKDGTGKKSKDN